jgi:hypothetical protein
LTEVGHGQEESEEGEEVREEEEESSGSKERREVGKENRRKEESGEEGARAQESGRQEEASASRDPHGGAAGACHGRACALDGGHPRGQDRAESRGGLAVSDGFQALMTCD